MRIAQITDSHLVGAGALWKGRVDTGAELRRAVARLNALAPDLVVHTGDLAETGTDVEYAEAQDILADLRAPLRLLPGNHDRRDGMRAAFPGQGWAPAGPLTFREDAGGLRLAGIDTVAEGETAGTFDAAQGAWLAEALAGAEAALIFAHHPPCDMGLPFMDVWPFRGEAHVAAALAGVPVLRVACGHVHAAADLHWRGTLVSACPALSVQIPPEQVPGPGAGWVPGRGAIRLFDRVAGGLSVKLVPLETGEGPFPFRD